MFLGGRTHKSFQRDPLVISTGILFVPLVCVSSVWVEVRKDAKHSEPIGQAHSKESPFPKSHLSRCKC